MSIPRLDLLENPWRKTIDRLTSWLRVFLRPTRQRPSWNRRFAVPCCACVIGTVAWGQTPQTLSSLPFAAAHPLDRELAEIASLPVQPIRALVKLEVPAIADRVHIAATVTYQSPTGSIYLQQDGFGLRVQPDRTVPDLNLHPGDMVDAWGFVSHSEIADTLQHAHVKFRAKGVAPQPACISAADVFQAAEGPNTASGNDPIFDNVLVRLDGVVIERIRSSRHPLWTFRQGGLTFQAEFNASSASGLVALEPGARVLLTGICSVERALNGSPQSFRILLRSPEDLRVLHVPDWTSALVLLGGTLLLVIVGSIFVWIAHRGRTHLVADAAVLAGMHARIRVVSKFLLILAAAMGVAFLIGWNCSETGLPYLSQIQAAMMPNAALGMLLGTVAMATGRRDRNTPLFYLWAACAALLTFIGAASVFEYLSNFDLHIDGIPLLHQGWLASEPNRGRMAPSTGVGLALLGCAIGLTKARRHAAFGQVLATAVAILSALNLIGYLYGYQVHHRANGHAIMALTTALALFVLSSAVLLRYPDEGVLGNICSGGLGGLMARRILPVVVLCPMIVGYVCLQGRLAGLYDTRFSLSLFALSNIVCFVFLIWSSAAMLNRLDAARAAAERSMRARDEKLDMVFGTGLTGDFTWDVAKDEVTAHRTVWKLYGEPDREGTGPGEWFRGRQHPEDRSAAEREVRRAAELRRPFEVEFRVIWPDGTTRWLESRGTPLFDAAGNFIQVDGLNIDTTDRKLAQIRQEQSQLLLRELADAMPQIVWTAARDGKVDFYNRRWLEYTGLPLEGDLFSVIHPEDAAGCVQRLKNSFAAGLPFELELRLRRAVDGEYRWHLARAVPVQDSHGAVERWFGTFTDIDDAKRAHAELEALNNSLEQRVQERSTQLAESEVRYRQLVDSVNDYAIYMLDSQGRVASWNAGAQRCMGYTSSEILGRHFAIFHPREAVERGYPDRELAMAAAHGICREEGRRVRKDGSTFWASVLLAAMKGPNGQITGFSKVIRDMTEQKGTEQLLISEQKRAEEANQAKSSFLAAMSHEIRTPMNAILGMADLLWETELDPTQRGYVSRFRRAGSNLLVLINDILDLSKIESQRFELESVEFDLKEVLERVSDLMEPKAVQKGVTLMMRVAPRTSTSLIGDPARLQQVLVNLVANAVKFTEEGSIVLAVAPHADNMPNHFEFSVRDTGIGIPQDKLTTIFEDFTQAETSTTRRFGGTGLGLGICRRLVEQMGGRLSVRSTVAEGSTFFFDAYFEIGETPREPKLDELRDLAGVRVLIVDDRATNRLIQSDMCSGWGMLPSPVSSVVEACWLAMEGVRAGEPFALVLLDHLMPDTEGFEALEKIRAAAPDAKIIVTSSNNQPGDVTRAKGLGAADYVSKPIRSSDLLAIVSAALRTNPPATPETPGKRDESAHPELDPIEVLVAEDSEDNRFLVAAYLKYDCYRLTFVSNGQEAVDIFRKREFDLILMDVQMPVLDGLTATRSIRALEREQSWTPTTIIALTANALVDDAQRTRSAGCNAHISKPISKERLIAVIESFRASYRSADSGSPELEDDATSEAKVAEAIAQLAKSYLAAQRNDLGRVRELLVQHDLASLETFGHNMKGTGTSLGFPEMSAFGKVIETAAMTADTQSIATSLNQLEGYLNEKQVA